MSISVIILTFNEERHIARCIKSVMSFSDEILVVDSFSIDNTVLIAEQLGAKVFQHSFVNHAQQLNWFLDFYEINSEWVLRLDADEVITSKLAETIKNQISLFGSEIAGATINRRVYFQGKWIKYGGMHPTPVLRLWKNKKARCEERWMDEHIIVDGDVTHLKGDLSDISLNSLSWWIQKHNDYASREAIEIVLSENFNLSQSTYFKLDLLALRKRWVKENVYSRISPGLRSLLYFIYRYFLRAGFLDGSKGFSFHFLQGFWYRYLVDLKIKELGKMIDSKDKSISQIIKEEYNIDIDKSNDYSNSKEG